MKFAGVFFVISKTRLENGYELPDTREISTKSAARVRWINKCDLVIIDEIGCLPISIADANLFFSLISQLYQTASVVITSDKGFGL